MFSLWTQAVEAKDITIQLPESEVVINQTLQNTWKGSGQEGLPLFMGRGTAHTKAYNIRAVYQWVEGLSEQVFVDKVEGKLIIENGRAVAFTPPTAGRRLDAALTTFAVVNALEKNEATVAATVIETEYKSSLANTNTLGIKELIARGESKFTGSPKNRRTNIEVGISKIRGVIIPQGGEFSFNENLGPVEASEGFVPELVIKRTGTVPELGGGLCQVSSTTFRAAMNAGLPITQRKNHSYAVQYYAPQGTDATIYPGVIDLKFINDTPGAILVWPYLKDKDTLIFDFYGTKDSREVELEKPVQYDRKSDGSMKAYWIRHVTKNGEKKTETFNSTYLPPALFHKEETFVATPGNPIPAEPTSGENTQTPPPPPPAATPAAESA